MSTSLSHALDSQLLMGQLNWEVANYLLDHGADVNAKDKQGFTPLSSAALQGHLPLIDLLVLRGAVQQRRSRTYDDGI